MPKNKPVGIARKVTEKEMKNYNEVKRPVGVGDLTTLIAVITFQA